MKNALLKTGSLLMCSLAALHVPQAHAAEEEVVEFDRPGIGFGTHTLAPGQFALEFGLPDASLTRDAGQRSTTLAANTLLRIGLARQLEIQLGANLLTSQRDHGDGVNQRTSGTGDGQLALKLALPSTREHISWAVMASTQLPWGEAPLGDGGNGHDIGMSAAFDLSESRSLALYLDYHHGDDGQGWLFSPSYSFALGEKTSAYVEAGIGERAQHMRAIGTGITWAPHPHVQLDASILRGLDEKTADWQGGIGLAVFFNQIKK